MQRWFILSIGLSLVLACNKPDVEHCQRACWNYNKVMFWDKVDAEVKAMKPAEAAVIRAQRELDFKEIQEREEDPGLLNCITNCQHNANKEQIVCMQEVKTAAAMSVCLE